MPVSNMPLLVRTFILYLKNTALYGKSLKDKKISQFSLKIASFILTSKNVQGGMKGQLVGPHEFRGMNLTEQE